MNIHTSPTPCRWVIIIAIKKYTWVISASSQDRIIKSVLFYLPKTTKILEIRATKPAVSLSVGERTKHLLKIRQLQFKRWNPGEKRPCKDAFQETGRVLLLCSVRIDGHRHLKKLPEAKERTEKSSLEFI